MSQAQQMQQTPPELVERNLTHQQIFNCRFRETGDCSGNHQRAGQMSKGSVVFYCPTNCKYWEAKK